MKMIVQLIRTQWLALARDRGALFLVYLMPLILFTVFAMIFGGGNSGGGGGSGSGVLRVAVLDLDDTDGSRRIVSALMSSDLVHRIPFPAEVDSPKGGSENDSSADRDELLRLIKTNQADAGVLFPKGLEDSIGDFGGERPEVEVIYDAANPLAQNMLSGMLQGTVFTAVPDLMLQKGLARAEQFTGPLTEKQRQGVSLFSSLFQTANSVSSDQKNAAEQTELSVGLSMSDGLIRIRTTSAMEPSEDGDRQPDMIAYYAAAVAVMFLMFSMAGSATAFVEHREKGTLERLISGQMSIARIVVAHWLYFVMMGVSGIAIMLLYAWAVFGLDLMHGPQLLGSVTMALVTAMTSAAFVMMLATLCRSRKRLESVSTIVILLMSALGGSMAPKFILPAVVQQTSLLAFNSWALDGFLKIFWYYDDQTPMLKSLTPQVGVILGMGSVFLLASIVLAKRWMRS